jgi:large subunit ribosomal protein L22
MTGPKTNEKPGTRAFLRGAPVSAFKVREVLDLIRGQDVERAADILRFCERGPAEPVGKLLASAVANAAANDEMDPEELYVSACYADESKTSRRVRPRARGRASRIRKRTAHVTIIVSRLPEDRLTRLRAKRISEQASRRVRRGDRAAGERARRTGRAAAAIEDVSTEAPATEDVSTEDVSTGDVLTEDVSTEDATTEDAVTEDVSHDDVPVAEASAEDVAVHDQVVEDEPADDDQGSAE